MSTTCTPAARVTRSLLGYGVLAGGFYVVVGLAQALTRDGFSLDKHAWSLLANGPFGWVQVANFILAGLMTIAAAVGLRRAIGRSAAPWLIGGYGVSLIGAGIFRADPAQGFPAGTPQIGNVTLNGMLHFMIGGVGFLCLIAACLVLGRRFARAGSPGLAWFSRATGIVFLAAFAGIASGSHGPTTLAFLAAVVLAWTWLAVVCTVHYRTEGA
ncbi:DUF998 domain-containing protein [Luedemannella helvata]|uniref:DUF998 domain-containing protein n=1 Tax=Luedemannella helvata TaxID=349315 RepID=A0ABN2JXH2_9ACTN